jgi:hypothetical protein
MPSDPAPSHIPFPVIVATVTPAKANTRPVSAAMSSSRIAGSSGALARRMKAVQLCRPRELFDSRTAVRSEKLSRPIAMTRTPKAITGERTGSGWVILWTPSYRENRAPTVNSTTATTKA